jgi:2-polyprenyl-3-methyl-5-hydroxy-6-metoxy-1,4-benzoquinol methylase
MVNKYDVEVDPRAANNAHAFMLDLVGWNRRVLELGAAAGHMTRALVEQRCRVTAVERDEGAVQQLQSIAEDVVLGDLDDPRVFADLDAIYDVVLAGDVLEHLLHPQEVLNRASRLVKPGGRIVISVPNVAHADVRLTLLLGKWEYRPWGLMDEGHTRFFTLDSLRVLVRNAGLTITEMHRVRVPAFESELAPDRAAIPTRVVDLILTDPEAETYQFVLEAVLDNGEYRVSRLADRVLELEQRLELAEIANQALRAAQDPIEMPASGPPDADDVAGLNVQIAELHNEIARLIQQLETAETARRIASERFEATVGTKTFRYTRRVRQLYGRMRSHG